MADEPGQPPALTTLSLAEKAPASQSIEQRITPFDVSGGVDASGKLLPVNYDKLIKEFGATPITVELLERFEKVTGHKAHRFMRRGIIQSHREFNKILDRHEKGEPFFLYTGRGPSSGSMHVGHSVPFEFTKYLQEVFDVPLVIMLTDDEKFLHNKDTKYEDAQRDARTNAKDIIAIGFDVKKTFIFQDTEYIPNSNSPTFYQNMMLLAKRTTVNSINATFGFTGSSNIGELFFPAVQSATAFATSFPHIFGDDPLQTRKIPSLIPCAIDQDPYFRQCRENAQQLKYQKPALIHAVFLPALQGPGSKMSASNKESAVYLDETPNQIKNKVNKHAFSGGQDTEEQHRKVGGRTEHDVAYQYLRFFMEDDDELEKVRKRYESGELLTGELKAICIKYLQDYVGAFKERRARVTDEDVKAFMAKRKLEYGGNPNPVLAEAKERKGEKEGKESTVEKGHSRSKSSGKSMSKANGAAT